MKQSKTAGNLSLGQYKSRYKSWKCKAILRGEENIALRKRIKELETSRDKWRSKCQVLKKEGREGSILGGEKASRHKYSLVLIALILEFHRYGSMSLRSCRHCVSCMLLSLGLSSSIPSHSSIRNWLCKCGYYRIKEGGETAGDYVIYVDESIVFGSEKMLLILGVSEGNIPTNRGLTHSDMEVLYVGASQQWKGEDIAAELVKIGKNKRIKYVVSDEGNNLKNAYKSLSYIHIEDCTHILANHLKHIYGATDEFEEFRKLIGTLRKEWNLSKEKSRYMPPTMRGKMRFANIFPCVAWAKSMRENWTNLSPKVQESLQFLQEKEAFIQSLIEVEIVFKTVCQTLKTEGFGEVQKATILAQLATMKVQEKAAIFIENCTQYLQNLATKSQELGQKHLLCSSDIIESYFGKFKTKINPNNRSGLTEFIFTIANFSRSFSIEETKDALENVTLKDIILIKKHHKVPQ